MEANSSLCTTRYGEAMIPGEYLLAADEIVLNAGRQSISLPVTNRGDRPIQVGSHFHFMEVNRALNFERAQALGMRLNIPSGTAVRFEPGQTHIIELVPIAGDRTIYGFNRLVEGTLRDKKIEEAARKKVNAFADSG